MRRVHLPPLKIEARIELQSGQLKLEVRTTRRRRRRGDRELRRFNLDARDEDVRQVERDVSWPGRDSNPRALCDWSSFIDTAQARIA